MRKILFKAKTIDGKRWVEGYYFAKPILKKYFIICDEAQWEIDINTLCQYTGFKGKNKNMIWENDILLYDDIKSVVRWDEEKASFVIDDYGVKGRLMEYGFDEDAGEYDVVETNSFDDFINTDILEVIGNIIDNKDLIER